MFSMCVVCEFCLCVYMCVYVVCEFFFVCVHGVCEFCLCVYVYVIVSFT